MDLVEGFQLLDWQVLPKDGRFVARHNGEVKNVRRKAMDVLCVLARSPGEVVERDAILAAVWGDRAVTDEPLTSTIGELRRLLGDTASDSRYIETVPKRGYRLVAGVQPYPTTITGTEGTGTTRRRPLIRLTSISATALAALVLMLAGTAFYLNQTVPAPDRSIAVLPFDNYSDDTQYFSDGLTEALTTTLTQLPELRVAAKTSAFSFRDSLLSLEDVAGRLKVAHILTGSVQREGNQVRINVQLIDTKAGYQRWSARYDRDLEDIFDIQQAIAAEVTDQLKLQLISDLPHIRTTSAEAYTLYLQARHVGRQHTQQGFTAAAERYHEALEIDPNYLPAWSDLAGLYVNMVGFSLMPADEGYRLASEAAYKALAIDPGYAPAHDRLGWIALHANNNLGSAATHYERALELAPGDGSIQSNAAVLALALGRLDDAVKLFEAVAATDPVSAVSHANLANAYLLAGRFRDAEQSIRNALTLSPRYTAGYYRLGRILLAQGKVEPARDAMSKEPFDAARLIGLALVHNAAGNIAASDAALQQVQEIFGDAAAGNYAQVYAHRGDADAAFRWLETEFETSGNAGFLEYRWDPVFVRLYADPRWPDLFEKIGLSAARLDAIPFTVASIKRTH